MYDYLVVDSGLYGATFAQQAKAHGKSVLVIDKRPNIAGQYLYRKRLKASISISMAHIFTPIIRKSGITCSSSLFSTVSQTLSSKL